MDTPDISKVIFSVLAGHGSVSLLSVGSLLSVRVPASFNADGTIEPPRHIVEYSNDISDELSVVDIITESYGMTPSEASACYNEWLSASSVRMANGTRITIEGVGTLSLLAEGAALFSIDERLRSLLNPYGSSNERLTVPGVPGRKKKNVAAKATSTRATHATGGSNTYSRQDRDVRTKPPHVRGNTPPRVRRDHTPPRARSNKHRVSPGNPRSDRLMILLVVILTAVCITLVSSIYFAPQGTGLHDRISADSLTLWADTAVKWMSDAVDAIAAFLGELTEWAMSLFDDGATTSAAPEGSTSR